jgi:hypothetical protein
VGVQDAETVIVGSRLALRLYRNARRFHKTGAMRDMIENTARRSRRDREE